MKKSLAFTNGIIIAFMVLVNGLLAKALGNYLALLIFFGVGLIISTIIVLIKKEHKNIFNNIPKYLLISGGLGVLNIFLNNVCVNKIGVALTLGLCLTGQIIFSAIFENFGFFGVIKKKLTIKKLPGYLLILAGAFVMIVMGIS
ncbi:MAG: DMT family transporter [Clostridiales bacterium]|nr:DMT family transporter [Clostridiales bacterium]